MKNVRKLLIVCNVVLAIPAFAEKFTVDTIKAVIYSEQGTEVVTQSDLGRLDLTGRPRSLEEIVFERLVVLDAKKMKVMPTQEEVEKYIEAIASANNIGTEEMKQVFASAGYTYEDGVEQMRVMQANNMMLDFKIRSGVIVSRKAVEKYYEENPEIEQAEYWIEYAFVPDEPDRPNEEQLQELERYAKTGKGIAFVDWSDPFDVKDNDIADDKSFIRDMEIGEIKVSKLDRLGGFELYRLVKKTPERLLSLDERYRDISELLKQPKFEQLMKQYRKNLYDSASIVYY